MKKILAAAVASLACFGALAQQPVENHQQQRFEQRKAVELAFRQNGINILQTGNGCIQGATTPDALRSCKTQEKASREAGRGQHQAQREQRQAGREARRAEHQQNAAQRRGAGPAAAS